MFEFFSIAFPRLEAPYDEAAFPALSAKALIRGSRSIPIGQNIDVIPGYCGPYCTMVLGVHLKNPSFDEITLGNIFW